MIFKYYDKKEELLQAIIIPFVEEFVPQILDNMLIQKEKNSPQNFEDFLRFIIQDRIDFLEENRKIFQVLIREVFLS